MIIICKICQLNDVSRTSVYKWIDAYSDLELGIKMVIEMESEASKTKQMLERNVELERFTGQTQLEIRELRNNLNQIPLFRCLKWSNPSQPILGMDN